MRTIVQDILSGVLVLAIAIFVFKTMTKEKEPKLYFEKQVVAPAQVAKVKNGTLPINLEASGRLEAKNTLEIFSEVQGIFEYTGVDFKAGTAYEKGQILVKINSEEFRSSMKIIKSAWYRTIVSMMSDLKFDFPESYEPWQYYLNQFDLDQNIADLPKAYTQKEKYFIANKNIYTQFYEIKNLEKTLAKYNIYAPYSGVLTESNVSRGSLIRTGQRLGKFIEPTVYELEISLSETLAKFLKVGNQVSIKDLNESHTWTGTVVRINAALEQTSQTKKIFIELKGDHLNEGMYLKAFIEGKQVKNVIEIDRSLIVNDQYIYTVKGDSVLSLKKIQIVHFNKNTAIIAGLKTDDKIITQPIPGAFEDMKVKIIE